MYKERKSSRSASGLRSSYNPARPYSKRPYAAKASPGAHHPILAMAVSDGSSQGPMVRGSKLKQWPRHRSNGPPTFGIRRPGVIESRPGAPTATPWTSPPG